MPARHATAPLPPRPRARAVAVALIAVAALAAVTVGPEVDAQAAPVHVTSRTTPAVPDPGDDVRVSVRATGCPPGGALVELYLTSNDGSSTAAAVMARQEARSTLFFRVHADIELPSAIEGWYGVRVVCGQYRPARQPIPGTYFRVGVDPKKEMRVLADQAVEGSTIRIEGSGCPGDTVEYSYSQSGLRASPFNVDGVILVGPDGNWGGDVLVPTKLAPGPAKVRARCGFLNTFGDQVWINYDVLADFEVIAAPK